MTYIGHFIILSACCHGQRMSKWWFQLLIEEFLRKIFQWSFIPVLSLCMLGGFVCCFIMLWAVTWYFQQCSILTSVDSDKPVQPTSKGSDQIARMRRLIWGFAGCTYHIVGNVMPWLKYCLRYIIRVSNNLDPMPGLICVLTARKCYQQMTLADKK